VPAGYDAARHHPLVVMLHGCTQDPDDLARGTRATEHADRHGLLVLFPEQPEAANAKKCWNWFEPAHQRRDTGEPSLIAGSTRQVMREWAVDGRRVYIGGISAGAAMASLVAIAYPDLFAAVALHSGIPYRAAGTVTEGLGVMANGAADTRRLARLAREEMGPRARPIPAIIIQGGDDAVVRPVNATHLRRMWLDMNAFARGEESGAPRPPYEPGRVFEADANGLHFVKECHGPPTRALGECEVVTILVHGLGHAWSGGSKLGTFTDERGPDATAEMIRFLLAHQMPTRARAPNARKP
jgi:poly(hydroxyalkanoate) depolymerase family esterase